MNFARLAEVSAAVAATQSRLEKRRLLAAALREAEEDEIDLVATYLSGRVRQRRTGVGWRSLADLPAPAEQATLTPTDVDAQLESVATLAGTGSQASRTAAVQALFGALTEPEQLFLRKLILGEVRQGALDFLLIEAIAEAAEVPVGTVRRAAMFSALTGPVARAALTGGAVALEEFRPAVLEPVRPMLASPAPDLAGALDKLRDDPATEVAADGKVDGIRVQVHKAGEEVAVFTRSLDDITERVPEIAEVVRAPPAAQLILDGEAIALDPSGRPRPFQETGGAHRQPRRRWQHHPADRLLLRPAAPGWANPDRCPGRRAPRRPGGGGARLVAGPAPGDR